MQGLPGTRKRGRSKTHAFTHTAAIVSCGSTFADDPHCGTFVEIHRKNGSPYVSSYGAQTRLCRNLTLLQTAPRTQHPEEFIISETRITERFVSGYFTSAISLRYDGDRNRVLCAYAENKIRIRSMVMIKQSAPQCCCPPIYSTQKYTGFKFCPKNPVEGATAPAMYRA